MALSTFRPPPARGIQQDTYQFVEVWRDGNLETSFTGRVANVRQRGDVLRKQGYVSPQSKVLYAPRGADVQAGDDVFSGGRRYRVAGVDQYAHNQHVIMNELQ